MKAVTIETDERPVEAVVTGEGGMEGRAPWKRTGMLAITIGVNVAPFSKAMQQIAQKMSQDFSQAMASVSMTTSLTMAEYERFEQAVGIYRKPPARRTIERVQWELARFDAQLQLALVSYGEWVLRTIGRVEHRAAKLWRWLWSNR